MTINERDRKALNTLKATIEQQGWVIVAALPYTASDYETHAAYVAQKAGGDKFYTFRAYTTIRGGGIEMEGRFSTASEAIENLPTAIKNRAIAAYGIEK